MEEGLGLKGVVGGRKFAILYTQWCPEKKTLTMDIHKHSLPMTKMLELLQELLGQVSCIARTKDC